MDIYNMLLKRVIMLTDEYLKIREELDDLKQQIATERTTKKEMRKIIPMNINRNNKTISMNKKEEMDIKNDKNDMK